MAKRRSQPARPRRAKSTEVFGHPPRALRAALYARVSTAEQQTIPAQLAALDEYAQRRGWVVVRRVGEVGSGAAQRPERQALLAAARRREVDVIAVWRMDRWGRSLADLVTTVEELSHLGVGFASVTEALDLTTPAGRALAGMLSVFAAFERDVLRERVRAGLAAAKAKGVKLGRPRTSDQHAPAVRRLATQRVSQAGIARKLGVPRATVRRILANQYSS